MALKLLSVSDALAAITGSISPLPFEDIALSLAQARYCAADQFAKLTHPPQPVSAMDGYAVRAGDVAGSGAKLTVPKLTVIDESAAGRPAQRIVRAGEAIRIFTGAVVPDGADAIILQEDVVRKGDEISVESAPIVGRFIRLAGQDFNKGDRLVSAGKQLTARDIALLASGGLGAAALPVLRKPRVAIINSGDELIDSGNLPMAGQLVNSNGVMLEAMLRQFGAEPVNLGKIPDHAGALNAALEAHSSPLDLIVTTGGASVGAHDHIVNDVHKGDPFAVHFWRIAMRPGKPLIYANWRSVPLLGLPGNPVSAGICALLFVQCAVCCLQGRKFQLQTGAAITASDLPENDQREEYLRAKSHQNDEGVLMAQPVASQDSSRLSMFAEADCLIVRPAFAPPIRSGALVPIVTFPHGF